MALNAVQTESLSPVFANPDSMVKTAKNKFVLLISVRMVNVSETDVMKLVFARKDGTDLFVHQLIHALSTLVLEKMKSAS